MEWSPWGGGEGEERVAPSVLADVEKEKYPRFYLSSASSVAPFSAPPSFLKLFALFLFAESSLYHLILALAATYVPTINRLVLA